ncbi:hypothetical protein QOZ80_7AG0558570 [Eleusine coracana subsp. coracana]|nr:hypothetical protein QOZ80_7AG0558570 [Eleusine coracana subsp. coracana]
MLTFTIKGPPGFHLFVGNLGLEIDQAFLTRVFSKFPSFVPGCAQVKRNADGTTRGYGYVTFSQRRDVEAAIAELDDQLVGMCRIRLSSCWCNEEARRMSPEQLMQRCEMRKRLMKERMIQEEAEERRRRAVF